MTQEWASGVNEVECKCTRVTVSGCYEKSDKGAGALTNEIRNSEHNPIEPVSLSS